MIPLTPFHQASLQQVTSVSILVMVSRYRTTPVLGIQKFTTRYLMITPPLSSTMQNQVWEQPIRDPVTDFGYLSVATTTVKNARRFWLSSEYYSYSCGFE